MKYCEFYDYPVTGRPLPIRCPGSFEYYPETSTPHPQPCPDDGVYRCPKCTTKGRYRIKLFIYDPTEAMDAAMCVVYNQEIVTDLDPTLWLMSFDLNPHLAAYNASRPSTLGMLAIKDIKMNFSVEKLVDF